MTWCKTFKIVNIIQWNFSIKTTLNKGHLSNEDTVCSPTRVVCKSTSELGTVLYTGQPAGSQWSPPLRGSNVYRTASWAPTVSSIERFHCTRNVLGCNIQNRERNTHHTNTPCFDDAFTKPRTMSPLDKSFRDSTSGSVGVLAPPSLDCRSDSRKWPSAFPITAPLQREIAIC